MVLTGSPSGKYPFDVEHSRRCCRITFAITGFVVASLVNFEPFFALLGLLIIVTTPKGLWTEICKKEKKLNLLNVLYPLVLIKQLLAAVWRILIWWFDVVQLLLMSCQVQARDKGQCC